VRKAEFPRRIIGNGRLPEMTYFHLKAISIKKPKGISQETRSSFFLLKIVNQIFFIKERKES
jgi:hypothetical protein